jgi:hypothetical protein
MFWYSNETNMEGSTSDNLEFSSTWITRSDKSEHISSWILWLGSGDNGTDDFLSDNGGNMGSSTETGKFKA